MKRVLFAFCCGLSLLFFSSCGGNVDKTPQDWMRGFWVEYQDDTFSSMMSDGWVEVSENGFFYSGSGAEEFMKGKDFFNTAGISSSVKTNNESTFVVSYRFTGKDYGGLRGEFTVNKMEDGKAELKWHAEWRAGSDLLELDRTEYYLKVEQTIPDWLCGEWTVCSDSDFSSTNGATFDIGERKVEISGLPAEYSQLNGDFDKIRIWKNGDDELELTVNSSIECIFSKIEGGVQLELDKYIAVPIYLARLAA